MRKACQESSQHDTFSFVDLAFQRKKKHRPCHDLGLEDEFPLSFLIFSKHVQDVIIYVNLLEPSRNDENAAIQKPSAESQPQASDQIHCSPVPALGEVGSGNLDLRIVNMDLPSGKVNHMEIVHIVLEAVGYE
jgi:hypothetical protein